MYKIISLVVAVIGAVLFFAPEYLIKKDSENQTLKMISEYHQVVAFVLFVIAYYMYTTETSYAETTVESSRTELSELPSYEKATE